MTHFRKIISKKHPGAVFIKRLGMDDYPGQGYVLKLYPEHRHLADVIVELLNRREDEKRV